MTMEQDARESLVLVPGLNNTRAVFDGVVRALPRNVEALEVAIRVVDLGAHPDEQVVERRRAEA